MTVVTLGGPCLTQTQIFRNEQQARYEQKLETKDAQALSTNPYAANTQRLEQATASEKASADKPRSYGAPGPHTVDILV